MSQDQAKQFLIQGINLAKAGQKDQARALIQNAIKLEPQNETAWLWMSSVARDNRERLFCLQNLLQINPQNEMALKAVQAMGVDPAQLVQKQAQTAQAGSPTAAASGSVPAVAPDRLNQIIPAVDLFLRNYQPLPMMGEEIEWGAKRMRYGEALARRRQTMRYAMMGGAALVLLLVVGFIGSSVLSSRNAEQVAIARATSTFTHTPTNTATATPGVTNTPSPVPPRTATPYQPPAGLAAGSEFGNPPTAVYPLVDPGLGREFANAIDLYGIGRYEEAFVIFERERDNANNTLRQCKPDTYYYEILGLAEQGGRQNLSDAEFLYRDALTRPPCDTHPMIAAAACVVDYLQFLETGAIDKYNSAVSFCDFAIEDIRPDRPIPVSVTTRARLYLLEEEPNYNAARAVLDSALDVWQADLNLLLVRARVEINAGRLQEALGFINQALYVDPTSEAALRLRVEAFLDIAAITDDPQERLGLYGTAVIWSQQYLIYYAGEPAGYLLLARSRYGEGKIELAEEALTRIITARGNLPPKDADVVRRAHVLRAQIYIDTNRYEEALEDTEFLLRQSPDSILLIEQQADLAYRLGEYKLALDGVTQVIADAESTRYDLELRRLRLITQICEFEVEVQCDYENAIATINDNFLFALSPEQQIEAKSYRAKARYQVVMEKAEGEITANERQVQLDQALADIREVLRVDETALDQYYFGLIQQARNRPEEALRAYEWIDLWAQWYEYPFADEIDERIEALREELGLDEDAT